MTTTLTWLPGGAQADYPTDLLVGDRLLVAVRVRRATDDPKWSGPREWWDYQVIVVTETGFETAGGDTWSSWDWSDASWYAKLDGLTLEVLQ